MRRRRTAAPSLDAVDTALAITTDTNFELSTDNSPIDDSLSSESSNISASALPEEEPVVAKPRRTRRPKVTASPEEMPTEISIAEEVPIASPELTVEPPKRARRPRKPATALAEEVVVSEESVTEEPILEILVAPTTVPITDSEAQDIPALTVVAAVDEDTLLESEAQVSDLLAESEAILEEVLGENVPEDRNARNRRNRRNRGRDNNRGAGNANNANSPVKELVPTTPARKRGPQVLARTFPLPALPVTTELAEVTLEVEVGKPVRKRGVRIPRTSCRILTPEGITVVSVEQAAVLLGSLVRVSEETGLSPVSETLTTLFAPPAPEYVPLALEVLERLPQVAVVPSKGLPDLQINGTSVLPAFLFVNTDVADDPETAREIAARQIARAYAAGVRLFTVLAHLPWKRKTGDRRFDLLDAAFALVAENAPDAHVLPRLIFSPSASWERANPDEMAFYNDGETGDVSIGSELFWNGEAKDALRAAVEHLAESAYAPQVLGIYLEHGEWFHPKGMGADRSVANTNGFRTWLKQYYHQSEVALRSAWYDGTVTFDTAEIPTVEAFAALATASGSQTVFLSDRETRIADFYAYTSSITAKRITDLAAIAKEASGGRLVVATSYGYTLEIARPNCGHYALADVLASADVDILTAPISYVGRMPGGSAPLPVPVDSIHLAGKLFVSEDDTKTYLALRETEDVYNPKIATEEGTRAVHARNVGTAIAKGCGISWMDLWGEGWLDDTATWEHLGSLIQLMQIVADQRRNADKPFAAPHVAVFVDEKSLFDMRGEEEPPILPQLIGRHRDVFARAGASVGYYLLSDLLKPEFPETPRLFVFLNTFHLPLTIRTAIQSRWQNNGRTFSWLFAPGVRDAGNIAELSETVGIQLRLQPWGSRTGTVVTDGRFPLTENAKGERFGEDKRVNPSLTVVDPKAQVLGEYVSSGSPSLAYRKHARWQTVFVGERDLPLPLVRGLFRLAGVPIVTPDDDAVQVGGDGFVSVHSAQSSGMTLYSPLRTEAAVYDALSGEIIAGSGFGARTDTFARATRLLLWASPDELSVRFNLQPETWDSAPPALIEDELPQATQSFVFENTTAPPPGPQLTRLYPVELSVSAEDIAQFEAALAGEIALLDKEDDGTGETEANRKKRRRRRRRGPRTDDGTTDMSGNEDGGEDDEDTESGTDLDMADAVFDLANLTQSAATFDADALLPLLTGDEGTTEISEDLMFPEPSNEPSTDPVADLMARLFALPGLGDNEQNSVMSEEAANRRLSLDQLLPFSTMDEPDDTSTLFEEPLVVGNDETPLLDPQVEEKQESVADEPEVAGETESVGLLASAVRSRRGRTTGGGGFASRLRRRAAERGPLESLTEIELSGDPVVVEEFVGTNSEAQDTELAPFVETDSAEEIVG